MAAATGVRVTGLTSVVRALQRLGISVDDLKDAFSKIAAEGAQRAAHHAPRKSGRLAGDVRGNRAKSKAVITAGRASVPYAGPIEYGWARRNIEPTLFLQKADEEMQPKALQLLEADINRLIAKEGLD